MFHGELGMIAKKICTFFPCHMLVKATKITIGQGSIFPYDPIELCKNFLAFFRTKVLCKGWREVNSMDLLLIKEEFQFRKKRKESANQLTRIDHTMNRNQIKMAQIKRAQDIGGHYLFSFFPKRTCFFF